MLTRSRLRPHKQPSSSTMCRMWSCLTSGGIEHPGQAECGGDGQKWLRANLMQLNLALPTHPMVLCSC